MTEAATLQKLSPALTTHSVGPPGDAGVTVGAGAGAVVVVGASVVVVGGAVVVGPAVVGGAAVVGSTVVGGAVVVVVDSVVSGPITDAGPPAVVVVKRKGVVVDSSTCGTPIGAAEELDARSLTGSPPPHPTTTLASAPAHTNQRSLRVTA